MAFNFLISTKINYNKGQSLELFLPVYVLHKSWRLVSHSFITSERMEKLLCIMAHTHPFNTAASFGGQRSPGYVIIAGCRVCQLLLLKRSLLLLVIRYQ